MSIAPKIIALSTLSTRDITADGARAVKQRFGYHLQAGSVAARTAVIYVDAVERLAKFLTAHDLPVDVTTINGEHVEAYIADILRHRSAGTAAFHYRALQQFFRWCVDESIIPASPMARIKPPKVEERPPEVLTEAQLKAILAACDGKDFESRRDRALIRLLIDTGCRRGELLGLRYAPDDPDENDVDLSARTLRVKGKGSRWRFVHIGKKAALDLDRYLDARESHAYAGNRELWIGRRGPVQGSGIFQIVRRRAREAGIEGAFVHLFRHTFAHTLKAAGMSDDDLMSLGGWKSRTMLTRYGASAQMARAHAAHDRLSPGDRL